MATTNKVEIEVKARVTGDESVGALGQKLTATAAAAKSLGNDSTGAAGGIATADTASKSLTATSGKLRDGMESVSEQLAKAKTELLALVGVGVGLEGVKDVTALADSYKNLEAKIKLTTDEGKAFDSAFEGVFDVAVRTNSAVEETGTLFTKLAEAGKTLGVSQAEALKLTETINQSIQLSGASADASRASITQLVQGLQSGVLRGDEFNSVMEQSPRLAKALADGLGVTTGELRKMAEAGQLSSATIIKALQSQSDAVQAEFGKLPATVGRAMTNLTTAFTAYVGEADKAGGYTTKLAGLIDGLAANLGTVATALIHTGQVVAAMKILSMVQDWIAASAAIKATAASTEIATASTIKGTAAKAQNTAATVANTTAQVANAAAARTATVTYDTFGTIINKQTPVLAGNAKAWSELALGVGSAAPKLAGAGTAAAAAAPQFGLLGSAVSGLARVLAPLLALDIAFNFKSYGTAIGEWAARLMGAKDRTLELAEADKRGREEAEATIAARKRQAVATQEAADRTFGLTKEGRALIVTFDELRTKGDSAAEAISKIGKGFDLSNIEGIRNAASVLDKLVADGKLSAKEFQDAWAQALSGQDLAKFETNFKAGLLQIQADAEKAATALADAIARGLSGKELKAFEDKAREAMSLATREAERFEKAVGAKLQAAIQRSGLDMAVISGGMGKAAQSAINDTEAIIAGLEKLKAQGVDTGQALTASLGKGISTADSVKALEAVRAQIESVRKVLGDKIADGLLDQAKQKANELKDALDKATPGINSLREAYAQLGLKTSEELAKIAKANKSAWEEIRKDGTASADTLKAAFSVYADSALAATGAVGSSQRAVTEATLRTEAAIKGLSVSYDENGRICVQTQAEAAAAVNRTTGHLHGQRDAVDSVTSSLERQNAALERTIAAQEKANALAERSADLERKRRNVDKEGFSTGKDGGRVVAGGDLTTATGIKRFLQQAGVTNDAQATAITREFLDTQGNVPYFDNQGQKKYGGDTLSAALLKAAEKITFGGGSSFGGAGNGFGGERGSAAPANNNQSSNTSQPSAPAKAPERPAAPAPVAPPTADSGGAKFSRASETNLTINVAAGVNMASRGQVESLARAIAPALENLQRKGAISAR